MSGRTRITATDVDTGESETIEIEADNFIVTCGPNRTVHSDTAHANGTNVVVIKRREWNEG